jgi:hypothetical protein
MMNLTEVEAATLLMRHHVGSLSPGMGLALLRIAEAAGRAAAKEADGSDAAAFLRDYEATLTRITRIAAVHQALVIAALEALLRQEREGT